MVTGKLPRIRPKPVAAEGDDCICPTSVRFPASCPRQTLIVICLAGSWQASDGGCPRNRLLVYLNQSRTRSQVVPTASLTSRLNQSGVSTPPARRYCPTIARAVGGSSRGERCAFPTLCNGVNSDAVIQLDMSTRNRRSSHAATRTSTKRIRTKQTCRFTVPTYRYAKRPLRTGPSTDQSPSKTGNEQQRVFIRHTCCNQSGLCVRVGIAVLGVLVISMGGG